MGDGRSKKADLRCSNPLPSPRPLKSSLCQSRVFFALFPPFIAILGTEKPRLVISLPPLFFFTTRLRLAVDRSGHRERCFCFDDRLVDVFFAHAARRCGSRWSSSVTAVFSSQKCPMFACLMAARRWSGWRRDCLTNRSRRRVETCSGRWIMKS